VADGLPLLFRTGLKGRVESIDIPLEALTEAISFARRAPKRLSDPAFLQRLTGTYSLAGTNADIELQGNTLVLSITGRPSLRLEAVDGTEFRLEKVKEVSLRFVLDKKEEVVKEIRVIQSGAVVVAKPVD